MDSSETSHQIESPDDAAVSTSLPAADSIVQTYAPMAPPRDSVDLYDAYDTDLCDGSCGGRCYWCIEYVNTRPPTAAYYHLINEPKAPSISIPNL